MVEEALCMQLGSLIKGCVMEDDVKQIAQQALASTLQRDAAYRENKDQLRFQVGISR